MSTEVSRTMRGLQVGLELIVAWACFLGRGFGSVDDPTRAPALALCDPVGVAMGSCVTATPNSIIARYQAFRPNNGLRV